MNKRLIGTLGVAVIALAGWYWTQGQPTKDPVSASAAGTSSAVSAAPMVEVMVPAEFSTQAGQGETYYNAVCASCHGADAAGQDGIAPPLVHRIYEPSHHGDAAFFLAARNGVRAHHWKFGNMPPVPQALTEAELGAIVAYVRELQRANGIN
ncbi:cytochrome c [Pseudorhodobacter turbinis]|uniref:Cytochrome c n=1 Tax=Pseudorhodobacter turbinis TaxID=2500533 RepID=A0A4P8EEQ7_9RHOB|nr:cytochrome c [Pseudorhodobacter turbinis]QCO55551.1 cytochrome c [Pseudorhodobacter turbinis]